MQTEEILGCIFNVSCYAMSRRVALHVWSDEYVLLIARLYYLCYRISRGNIELKYS